MAPLIHLIRDHSTRDHDYARARVLTRYPFGQPHSNFNNVFRRESIMRILLGIAIGLFLAWNVKQPALMKQLQDWGLYQFDVYVDQLCQKYKTLDETRGL